MEDLKISGGKLSEIIINGKSHKPEIVILATGNASRKTFEILNDYNAIEAKPFAVGFRVEHPQEFINQAFYGERTDISLTGPATYRLTAKINDKGVYSFCMCPGGYVIGAATEAKHLVVNGMSFSNRANQFANSAIVAAVSEKDTGAGALAGVEYQKSIETKCFQFSGNYAAPAQTAIDFLKTEPTKQKIVTSYLPGVNPIDINNCYPGQLTNALKQALLEFDKKVPGFVKMGILIAPETRTSSPVRIKRDSRDFNSLVATNLYPAGEGSGYAGGIISSAVDGYKISQLFHF
jgi:uncharacterized FAD-dependent dehydrogenase